jgi:hypothetical protein
MNKSEILKRLKEARSDLVPELKAEFKNAEFLPEKRMLVSTRGNVLVIELGMNGATFKAKSEFEGGV